MPWAPAFSVDRKSGADANRQLLVDCSGEQRRTSPCTVPTAFNDYAKVPMVIGRQAHRQPATKDDFRRSKYKIEMTSFETPLHSQELPTFNLVCESIPSAYDPLRSATKGATHQQ
jgi:hypothetical protein